MPDVRIVRSATKELESMPQKVVDRIVAKDGLDQHPLTAGESLQWLEVDGSRWPLRVRKTGYYFLHGQNEKNHAID